LEKLTFKFPVSYGRGLLELIAWSGVLEKLSNLIAFFNNKYLKYILGVESQL
jgi:hypothetical protein